MYTHSITFTSIHLSWRQKTRIYFKNEFFFIIIYSNKQTKNNRVKFKGQGFRKLRADLGTNNVVHFILCFFPHVCDVIWFVSLCDIFVPSFSNIKIFSVFVSNPPSSGTCFVCCFSTISCWCFLFGMNVIQWFERQKTKTKQNVNE